MENILLSVTGLRKEYNSFCLKDVSFSLPERSITGLVGRNGAGKSTLLKTCMGTIPRDAGDIVFMGKAIGDEGLPRQIVGMVAEQHPLYDTMRAREFLAFCSKVYPTWDWSYCCALRERLAIDPVLRVQDLSHGTRTKLALVAALSFRPRLLILDEPTTGLDPAVRAEFLSELRECVTANGARTAVLFSSHLIEDISFVADRLLIMRNGSLATVESLPELLKGWGALSLEGEVNEVKSILQRRFGHGFLASPGNKAEMFVPVAEVDEICSLAGAAGAKITGFRQATLNEVLMVMV